MKIKVEYEISIFDDYTLYFFYVRKEEIGKEFCWIWDEDKLLEHEAVKKYPKSKYEWVLYDDN